MASVHSPFYISCESHRAVFCDLPPRFAKLSRARSTFFKSTAVRIFSIIALILRPNTTVSSHPSNRSIENMSHIAPSPYEPRRIFVFCHPRTASNLLLRRLEKHPQLQVIFLQYKLKGKKHHGFAFVIKEGTRPDQKRRYSHTHSLGLGLPAQKSWTSERGSRLCCPNHSDKEPVMRLTRKPSTGCKAPWPVLNKALVPSSPARFAITD